MISVLPLTVVPVSPAWPAVPTAGPVQKDTLYQDATTGTVMQLPRGTFCAIRKNEGIAGLILELEQSGFTGICSLSLRAGTATMVFSSGSCILAEIFGKNGDPAFVGLMAMGSETADAALSTLDATQVRLALDFNGNCRTTTMASQVTKTPHVARPVQDPAGTPAPRDLDESLFESPADTTPPGKPAEGIDEEIPVPGEGYEDAIDTLDHMDLDAVSDKIRKDCKTLITQLDLDHLMGR